MAIPQRFRKLVSESVWRFRADTETETNATHDAEVQPHLNLRLARVYINGADPKLATRMWQDVMEHIVSQKTDETRRRWDVAIKDKNFDGIRHLTVTETRPHFAMRQRIVFRAPSRLPPVSFNMRQLASPLASAMPLIFVLQGSMDNR